MKYKCRVVIHDSWIVGGVDIHTKDPVGSDNGVQLVVVPGVVWLDQY